MRLRSLSNAGAARYDARRLGVKLQVSFEVAFLNSFLRSLISITTIQLARLVMALPVQAFRARRH
jgi:hypothetical protein